MDAVALRPSGDEYAEIQRQLDESGLFEVTLESTEWNQYSEAAFTDKYPVYQLGWFPDYPDADNYTSSFYSKDNFLNIHYENPEMEKLLAEERASTEESVREQAFAEIQEIGAEDAPTVPYHRARPGRGGAGGCQRSRGHARPVVHLPPLADLEGVGQPHPPGGPPARGGGDLHRRTGSVSSTGNRYAPMC